MVPSRALISFSSDVHGSDSDDLPRYGRTEHPTRTRLGDKTRAISLPSRSTLHPTYSLDRDASASPPRIPSPQLGTPPDLSAPSKTYAFVSLPGNAIKKRPRRRYDEIKRLYNCSWAGCTKSYGTLNHLNAHIVMERHGTSRTPAEFKEIKKQWRKAKKDETERLARPDSSARPRGHSTLGRSSAGETREPDK
ncbi:hypothetical protein EDB89DRAFT_1858423 [Lactarius sanguifluus]|nr:hypothetical protein EDB89DRAFT_1858423 [Lactarius sanguifluus]